MLTAYHDIMSRIPELPKWFDEEGVPRYLDFSPRYIANIYADEAALVEIACQNCGQRFPVAFSRSKTDLRRMLTGEPFLSLADEIRGAGIHYGDPPNVGCCPSGPTMNCLDLAVVEYWHRERFDWTRVPDLEISLPDSEEIADVR